VVMACLQTAHVEEPLRGSELGNGQLPAGMASAGEAVVAPAEASQIVSRSFVPVWCMHDSLSTRVHGRAGINR
jgi:hypothetical protein